MDAKNKKFRHKHRVFARNRVRGTRFSHAQFEFLTRALYRCLSEVSAACFSWVCLSQAARRSAFRQSSGPRRVPGRNEKTRFFTRVCLSSEQPGETRSVRAPALVGYRVVTKNALFYLGLSESEQPGETRSVRAPVLVRYRVVTEARALPGSA